MMEQEDRVFSSIVGAHVTTKRTMRSIMERTTQSGFKLVELSWCVAQGHGYGRHVWQSAAELSLKAGTIGLPPATALACKGTSAHIATSGRTPASATPIAAQIAARPDCCRPWSMGVGRPVKEWDVDGTVDLPHEILNL